MRNLKRVLLGISILLLVLAILLTTLAISGLTGWLLVRYSALPGATGAWGSSPGGASAMVVMAQEYGADVRLVALMQYLRVLFVVGAAALVVRYALGNEAQEMTQDIVWFPSLTLNFPFTLLLTAVAAWLCAEALGPARILPWAALQTLLGTSNVAVSIDAVHYCVKARGIRDATSATTTTSLGGLFKSSQNTRQEFLRAVRHHN